MFEHVTMSSATPYSSRRIEWEVHGSGTVVPPKRNPAAAVHSQPSRVPRPYEIFVGPGYEAIAGLVVTMVSSHLRTHKGTACWQCNTSVLHKIEELVC